MNCLRMTWSPGIPRFLGFLAGGICLDLFSVMRFEMGWKPNEVTVTPVLSACVIGCSRYKFVSSLPWK